VRGRYPPSGRLVGDGAVVVALAAVGNAAVAVGPGKVLAALTSRRYDVGASANAWIGVPEISPGFFFARTSIIQPTAMSEIDAHSDVAVQTGARGARRQSGRCGCGSRVRIASAAWRSTPAPCD
jgi:hypothetical protein